MTEPARGDLAGTAGSPRRDDEPTGAQQDAKHPPQGPREARPRKREIRS